MDARVYHSYFYYFTPGCIEFLLYLEFVKKLLPVNNYILSTLDACGITSMEWPTESWPYLGTVVSGMLGTCYYLCM